MSELYVLDSSAILAIVNHEPGQDIVRSLIFDSVISTVTLAEIHTKLTEWEGHGADMAAETLFSLKGVVPFHENQAVLCGELRTATRSAGLSLGDRACIALATTLEAPACKGRLTYPSG